MNVRIEKEFHSLFWVWLVAASIGVLPLLYSLLTNVLAHEFYINIGRTDSYKSAYFLANCAFMVGVALLAALPFGNEFQERTLSMLLSQPCSREQIWREKMLAPVILILLLVLAHAIGYLPAINHSAVAEQLRTTPAFVVFLFCAGTYWTLFSRSIIGGVALSLFNLAVLYLLAFAFTQKAYFIFGNTDLQLATENLLIISSLSLAPIFFWLSWRKFSRLDVPSHFGFEAGGHMTSSSINRSFAALRSTTDSPITNLARKELRLLRPAFTMMGLFSSLWLLTAFIAWLLPSKQELMTDIINGFSAIYAPLLLLVAGSLSLGEEKNLGIHAINLSSPIPIRTQWFVKNIMACLTGLLGTMVLLAVMTFLVGHQVTIMPAKIFTESAGFLTTICILIILLVQICFWAATVTNRTIHAAFLASLSVMGFATLFNIGMWLGQLTGLLAQKPVLFLMAHFQVSSQAFLYGIGLASLWSLFIGFALVIVPGWIYFRRLHNETKDQFLSLRLPSITLLSFGMIAGALNNCLQENNFKESSLYRETSTALQILRINNYEPGQKLSYTLRPQELVATGQLSDQTKRWLRNSTIMITYNPSKSFILVNIDINFPSPGARDTIYMKLPPPPTNQNQP